MSKKCQNSVISNAELTFGLVNVQVQSFRESVYNIIIHAFHEANQTIIVILIHLRLLEHKA